MKISNIVEVNLENTPSVSGLSNSLNTTAGVLVVIDAAGANDTVWVPVANLLATSNTWPGTTAGAAGKAALGRLAKTFSNNGGLNLVAKRIYADSDPNLLDTIEEAIKGGATHTAIDEKVINIMLIDEDNQTTGFIGALAEKLQSKNSPNEEKILMLNTTVAAIPSLPPEVDNVFINVYDQKAEGGAPDVNNYEVALAAAYVSKIDYERNQIKGFEYTPFLGYVSAENNLNIASEMPNHATKVNFITPLVNRYLAIGGIMNNGTNYITKYFSIVLNQKITAALAELVVNKLKFENATYSSITNTLTIVLDVFARNGLLDLEFVADVERQVMISEPAGDTLYRTVERGEIFTEGYKVFTLPPSVTDLANKTYSGVYVYVAIGNQIRTINVNGLVLGGV